MGHGGGRPSLGAVGRHGMGWDGASSRRAAAPNPCPLRATNSTDSGMCLGHSLGLLPQGTFPWCMKKK